MNLAYLGNDLQLVTGGRFVLGLGLAGPPAHREPLQREWSEPARRMREMCARSARSVTAWETGEPLAFEGEFYRHTLMIPAFDPGPNPFGRPPVLRRRLRARGW